MPEHRDDLVNTVLERLNEIQDPCSVAAGTSIGLTEMGLVDAVCEEGASVATAMTWAREVARAAPGAIAGLKELLRQAIESPRTRQRARERSLFVEAWTSPDHQEAVEAFFEARPPRWGD